MEGGQGVLLAQKKGLVHSGGIWGIGALVKRSHRVDPENSWSSDARAGRRVDGPSVRVVEDTTATQNGRKEWLFYRPDGDASFTGEERTGHCPLSGGYNETRGKNDPSPRKKV